MMLNSAFKILNVFEFQEKVKQNLTKWVSQIPLFPIKA